MKNCRQICLFLLALMVSTYAAADIRVLQLPTADEVYPQTINWRGRTVLHVGDSHVSRGLTFGLRQKMKQAGAIYRTKAWIGSRSKSWVASGRLRRLLDRTTPHIVIVTLGTNAMGNRHPERQTSWMKALVQKIGPRKCFWMGPPPLLEDEHGFNETLKEACAPCKYFDTRQLGFKARADKKFHLTHKQGEHWADQTWRWMNGQTVLPFEKQEPNHAL